MNKILTLESLLQTLKIFREKSTRIVFTNGCFDILHVGHVRYLTAARAKGDLLILGLNSDESVKHIKGDKRPIICQEERAEVLAGLWCVDYITIFDEPDPLKLIKAISPDVLVKGADWQEENIIGADFVKAKGGRVERISVVPGASTSQIIQRIIELGIV